jgi:HAD superfamily hydrolase (TIGR01509 family)
MPDALLFDFDGVVVDSEPVHLACFREVLARRDIDLATRDYYTKYLGFDDHDCFATVLADNGREVDEALIAEMTAEKTAAVQRVFADTVRPLPGAVELMRSARSGGVAVAICSGALREEIELAGRTVGATEHVQALIAAEDVSAGKPDPEGYRMAMAELATRTGRTPDPARCWVIEDSPAGVAAGKAAGCRVLAVTTSYPAEALHEADRVVDSLEAVSLEQLD